MNIPLGLFAATLAAAMPILSGCSGAVPRTSTQTTRPAAAVRVDLGSNALARVSKLCALGPRDALTPGAERAAKWIADELSAIGLEPSTDTFDDPSPDGNSRTFRNVLATISGTGRGRVLLLSHYDTKSGISSSFVGANDGGSSTGLLLELAALFAKEPPAPSVTFAFLDGEECRVAYGASDGLHGSRRLARRMREAGERADAVILLDMVGDRDLCLTLPRNGASNLKVMLLDAAAAQGLRDKVKLFPSDMLDDHQPFLEAGFPAIDLIDFEYGSAPGLRNFWHTDADTVDKLSAESLRAIGAIVIQMIGDVCAGKQGHAP